MLPSTSCLGGGTAPRTEPLAHSSCLSLGRCLHRASCIFLGQRGSEAAWGALRNPAKSQGLNPLLRPVLLQTVPLFPRSCCCNRSRAAWVLATGRAELCPGPCQQQDLLIKRRRIGFVFILGKVTHAALLPIQHNLLPLGNAGASLVFSAARSKEIIFKRSEVGCTALDGKAKDGAKAWGLQVAVSAETAE